MVKYYCTWQGRSEDESILYILTKIMAIIVPIVQWFILCLFFGKHFQVYGVNIIQTYFCNTWPNPADVLFPKHVMCETTHYTFSGHLQSMSFMCDVQSHHLLRWSMFFFWFWMLLMFIIGFIHLVYIAYLYSKAGNIKFGDWIILRFLSCNLNAYDFAQFMVFYTEKRKNGFVIDEV